MYIERTTKTNLLGVVLDNNLKFDTHISGLCRKVRAQINTRNRLKNILPLRLKSHYIAHLFYLIIAIRCGTNVEKGILLKLRNK